MTNPPASSDRRHWVYGGLALAVIVVIAFLAGRLTAAQPSTKEEARSEKKVEYVQVESAQAAATIAQLRTELELARARVRTVVITKRLPSGEVTRVKTTDTQLERKVEREEKTDVKASGQASRAAAAAATQVDTHSKVVTALDPNWKAGVMMGANVAQLTNPRLVVGGQVEVRIWRLWLGGYVLSDGNVGGKGSLEWTW